MALRTVVPRFSTVLSRFAAFLFYLFGVLASRLFLFCVRLLTFRVAVFAIALFRKLLKFINKQL